MAIVGRAKYTRARAEFRGDAPLVWRRLEISRARACVFRPLHNGRRQNTHSLQNKTKNHFSTRDIEA